MIFLILTAWRPRILTAATLFVSFAAGFGDLEAKEEKKSLSEGHDVFIFSDFTGNKAVPEWKYAGAVEGWEKELGERMGEDVRITIVSTELGLEGLEMVGEPSVAVVPIVEKDRFVGMIPEFLVEHSGGLYSKFMLLAPRGSENSEGISTVRIGLFDSTMAMPWCGRVWAHSILPELAITSIRPVRGSDNVVLPVFFKRAAYGVVDLDGFETEVKRNPQVEERVEVIAESPPILGSAVFMREDLSLSTAEKFRREFVQSSRGENGTIVFEVLGWHALRPVDKKEEAMIAETIAVLTGKDRDGATADSKAKGATR